MIAIAALCHYKPQKNGLVYGVARVSYIFTSLKYLMATFDVAKVDTPGRLDAESMEILGYAMIILDLIVIVGACAVMVVIFVNFKRKLATIARKGSGKGKGGGASGAGSSNENSLVRVQPTKMLARRVSLKQIQTAVHHDKIVTFSMFHEKQRNAALDAIRAREKLADARVRARLIERRNKKSLHVQTQARQKTQNENLKSWKAAPSTDIHATVSSPTLSPDELVEVEKIRVTILGKVKTMKKLNRLFVKIDVDHSGMMSKKEFERLVEATLKKKVAETLVDMVWNAVWEERKHGENDEMDASTMGHWLKLEME